MSISSNGPIAGKSLVYGQESGLLLRKAPTNYQPKNGFGRGFCRLYYFHDASYSAAPLSLNILENFDLKMEPIRQLPPRDCARPKLMLPVMAAEVSFVKSGQAAFQEYAKELAKI